MSQELFVESELAVSESNIHHGKGRSAAATSARPIGVLVRGAVYGGSGYADETLAVVLGLADNGIPVELQPVHMQTDVMNLLAPNVRDSLEMLKLQRVDSARSVIFQCVTADEFNCDLYSRCRVGRTTFETNRLPVGWLDACEAMDEVWVPSQFNRSVFAAEGVDEKKLRVLPQGVFTHIFRPDVEALEIPHRRGFNFLSIFEWTQRKGPEILLRAFLTEFKADEDVALILKTYARPDPRADILPRLLQLVEREAGVPLENAPPIILLPGFMRNEDVPRLYRAADAFVLPSRGEGWGRPYMEALASECPVIATRWSGQLDFLNDGNSYLIDCKVVQAPPTIDVELYAGHGWAEPDFKQLRHTMRHVFAHRDEARQRASQGRREMVERWDWDVVIQQWVAEFRRLLGN